MYVEGGGMMETSDVRKKGRFKVTLAECVLFLIMIAAILLLITDSVERFLEVIYNPYAYAVLVIMMVEYVLLKSSDRSRIYQMQIDQLQQARHDDITFIRSIESRLSILAKEVKKDDVKEKLNSIATELNELATLVRTKE